MWVSRKEFDSLKAELRELEYKFGSLSITVPQFPPYYYDGPTFDLSYGDAIRKLAAHIGCEFKYQEGTPTTAVLVKKAK